MPVKISTDESKEIVKRLIRNAFDKIDRSMDFIYNESDKLISTAQHLGLNEFAEELKRDK
jgi:hypothetical protein